ncbi:hypothetical protein SEA_OTTAWA_80 [Arthrobacter phage Ottawa]|nr:hypothetical protein SEA_KHARCHO_80 [Arthrobacter phage Kharcho]WIC89312.1 hypothetical protein SEA_OTTAWA_80 [Arthrobacter phage Ottawa]
MTATIRNLDETLPIIKPETRRLPATTPPKPRGTTTTPKTKSSKVSHREPTMNELIIEDAVGRMERKAKKRGTTATEYSQAAIYSVVATRVDIAKYGRNPRREIEQMQKTLSMLTWELGVILEDIDSFGETTTKKEA